MKDNLSIVITIMVFVLLIVIFPLYNYFERQDDMSYNLVLKTTTNFVDSVLDSGYLDQDMYNKFVNDLAATGNAYDIELEAHKKLITKDANNATQYDEQYEIDYNDDIFEPLNTNSATITNVNDKTLKKGSYLLNEGDQFYVKLKNSNTTMAGAIFNTIVPTSKKDRISVNYGGIIKNTSWKEVASTYIGYDSKVAIPTIVTTPNIVNNSKIKPQSINFKVIVPDSIDQNTLNDSNYKWKIFNSDGFVEKSIDRYTI
jgi:hypothetical protein